MPLSKDLFKPRVEMCRCGHWADAHVSKTGPCNARKYDDLSGVRQPCTCAAFVNEESRTDAA